MLPESEEKKVHKTISNKRKYHAPRLVCYGAVRNLTLSGGTLSNESAAVKKPVASDRRVKENIVRVGEHPLGIGLYLFDHKPEYREKWGSGRQFGVMADEVETVMPKAVSVHPDGYNLVNYAMLRIYQSIQ